MNKPRDIAAGILLKIELDGAYSSLSLNEFLKKYNPADSRDTSLVTALVYGVCERKITLDYNIGLYLKSSIKKLHPAVLTYLRLGAFQILFSDKIPDRAAINESVESAKKNKAAFAAGMINAVLRRISENGLVIPEGGSKLTALSVKYSCPEELIEHFIDSYGEARAEAILSASIGKRPVFIKVNTMKTTAGQLFSSLAADNVNVEKTDSENCLVISDCGDITALKAYRNGEFFVQDKSSQTACSFLEAQPGETVVDCCAAPGGKSFSTAIAMHNTGRLLSCDIYPHKTELIEKGAERLGITCINTVCADARKLKSTVKNADRVLCDVPCSGFGVIGRKPEIKYRNLSESEKLPELQSDILENCSELVKPGGVLVYSTCTLNPRENEEICDAFLKKHGDFRICDEGKYAECRTGDRYITFFPEINGGDGFFVAKFIRSC